MNKLMLISRIVEHKKLLNEVNQLSYEEVVVHLIRTLPSIWIEAYKKDCNHLTDICIITHGTFEFIYDDVDSLKVKGIVPEDSKNASRIVAILGKSLPMKKNRDDYRLRGWVGPTEKIYGRNWDKGHFIAHSIGGAVDQMELNVFKQKRELNRGWSLEGKLYRKMEEYCFRNSGTFCFNRPIYTDQSDKPSFLEFGILKPNKELWVELFNNQD